MERRECEEGTGANRSVLAALRGEKTRRRFCLRERFIPVIQDDMETSPFFPLSSPRNGHRHHPCILVEPLELLFNAICFL